MLDPTTAAAANFGDGNQTPVWPSGADKSPNLYAQPGAPRDTPGADKCEKTVSAFHSAEGPPENVAADADGTAPAADESPAARSPGRPKEFDDFRKAQVCGLIAAGISQRQAAAYVGFSPSMVATALRRDKKFAADVSRAMALAKFQPLYKVIKASERSWRAAVWLLENAQPHTDLSEREARRAARRAEKEALKQEERDREARRRRQREHDEEFNATVERLRPR